MNSEHVCEFRIPLNRQTGPVIVGIVTLFLWSVMSCFSGTLTSGPLGNSTGILLFGFTIGNITRYWDPFIMGVFAGFVTHLWEKVPPIRYSWLNTTNSAIAGVGFSALLAMMLKENYWNLFQGIGFSRVFTGCLAIIIVTPFGMRGAIASTVICSLGLSVAQGTIPAVLFVTLVYLGKWANWWIFNIIRHGFTGAKSALKQSGEAGAVVQQS